MHCLLWPRNIRELRIPASPLPPPRFPMVVNSCAFTSIILRLLSPSSPSSFHHLHGTKQAQKAELLHPPAWGGIARLPGAGLVLLPSPPVPTACSFPHEQRCCPPPALHNCSVLIHNSCSARRSPLWLLVWRDQELPTPTAARTGLNF